MEANLLTIKVVYDKIRRLPQFVLAPSSSFDLCLDFTSIRLAAIQPYSDDSVHMVQMITTLVVLCAPLDLRFWKPGSLEIHDPDLLWSYRDAAQNQKTG